jgi:nucleotide-binding universal stress UspA family protein
MAVALYAYDASDDARRALEQGAERLAGREAVVVTVWSSLEGAAAAGLLALPAGVAHQAVDSIDAESEQQALATAEKGAELLKSLGVAASARAVRRAGSEWAAILDAAEEVGADTIVIGSRGLGGLKRALLGSVSSGVAQHSHVPVLIGRA